MRTLSLPLGPFLALAIALSFALTPPQAHAKSIELIRDAEIESTIREYSKPIFQAAGLNPNAIKLYLVKDKSINAFVAGGANMFLHTGLLMQADGPLQVIGVIAHEAGHISGGHVAGRGKLADQATVGVLATYVLGLGAALATGEPGLAQAILSGGQDVILKGLLSYTRAQESAADQAAVTYLKSAKQSPDGLLSFMEKLEGQEIFLASNQDPYLRTHPLTQDRIEFFRRMAKDSPYHGKEPSPELKRQHERMVAKLTGFLESETKVLREYPESDDSLPARYARSIAYYRAGKLDQALAAMDSLLSDYPEDPYFQELKGQMLFENGRIAESIPPLRKAVELAPEANPIRQILARALIEANDPQLYDSAIMHLNRVLQEEPSNGFAWRLAAIAYGRTGQEDMAALALAEYALATGKSAEARGRAQRASDLLESGSPGWLQAQDVLREAERRLDND